MKSSAEKMSIRELMDYKKNGMLAANPEYQRGTVWKEAQQKKLIDSLLRGYPIPAIYLHHIKKDMGKFGRDDLEIIDGQQRLNAIYLYVEGAFPLFDPLEDEEKARFPAFIKEQPCPWAGKRFEDLTDELREEFLGTKINISMIETDNSNEVRDLFVRLQAGAPLNHQETRDAWPGNFTELILKLGGKPEVARYQGHPFFRTVMRLKPDRDRGKTRQFAAQIAMALLTKRRDSPAEFCDINASEINAFYYDNLEISFDDPDVKRLQSILTKLERLLPEGQHPKLLGHTAIHCVLLVDSLMDDYAKNWEDRFPAALDAFVEKLAEAAKDAREEKSNEYWTKYGQWTRTASDKGQTIARRHRFFMEKMLELMQPLEVKDSKRLYGELERTILYLRQGKRCLVCDGQADWDDIEVHHVKEHSSGGQTTLENGAVVHKACHPKSKADTAKFAKRFAAHNALKDAMGSS